MLLYKGESSRTNTVFCSIKIDFIIFTKFSTDYFIFVEVLHHKDISFKK